MKEENQRALLKKTSVMGGFAKMHILTINQRHMNDKKSIVGYSRGENAGSWHADNLFFYFLKRRAKSVLTHWHKTSLRHTLIQTGWNIWKSQAATTKTKEKMFRLSANRLSLWLFPITGIRNPGIMLPVYYVYMSSLLKPSSRSFQVFFPYLKKKNSIVAECKWV